MINLEQAKLHCVVETDEWDSLLQGYIDAAYSHFASIGIDVEADPIPADIDHAALLLVCHWFGHREAATDQDVVRPIPFGVSRLLAPHREVTL